MTTKRNAIIIKDAIADLEVIGILASRGRKEEAQTELFNLWQTVNNILGGDKQVRDLLDEFDKGFQKLMCKEGM